MPQQRDHWGVWGICWSDKPYKQNIYLKNCASLLHQEHCLQLMLQTMRLQKVPLIQSTTRFYSALGSQMETWPCGGTRKPSGRRKELLEPAWVWEAGVRSESEMMHMGWACEDAACVDVRVLWESAENFLAFGWLLALWRMLKESAWAGKQICLSWKAVPWNISLRAITEFVVSMALSKEIVR